MNTARIASSICASKCFTMYPSCVQGEVICVANARLRKGVYTPKGVRGVYTYAGSHSKTVVFGLITLDGEGSSGDTAPLLERSLSSS